MKRLGRGIAAAISIFMLAGASTAQAQTAPANAARVDLSAKPLGGLGQAVTNAVATITGTVMQPQPAQTVSVRLQPEIAREAAWLHKNGWPLYALVDRYSAGALLDEQANCIATAVYHEARGESLDGQLAVARVIMNRAASGKYPTSWCGTVKQPWQFSFVNPRTGNMPYTDTNCDAWRKAVAITRIAMANAVPSLDTNVLWYHADYVAPSWGRRLTQVSKIGTHVFYRA